MAAAPHEAERRCPGYGISQPLHAYRLPGDAVADAHCVDCRERRGELRRPGAQTGARLMQALRAPGAPKPMTPTECALVGAARVIAARDWDLFGGDQPALHQRLRAALFAAGIHVHVGSYREAARLEGFVVVDFDFGSVDALTTRLLDLAGRSRHEAGGWLLITRAHLPGGVINAVERFARRPIGVYPQIED